MSAARNTGRWTRLPKLLGADVELGNFVLGHETRAGSEDALGSGREAALALLAEVRGIPGTRHAGGYPGHGAYGGATGWTGWTGGEAGAGQRHAYSNDDEATDDRQDWGRKWLPGNGACIYIDLDHLEVCLPETLDARDHLAAWHAMLRVARDAQQAANARRPDGERVVVLANTSDGRGHSYGSHSNFLVSRGFFDDLFDNRMHPELFVLMAFQVSSIVLTGQGKVGAENEQPAVDFQIAQRADFFETTVAEQTTYARPLVNRRDEPLAGAGSGRWVRRDRADFARLHCIFFDSTLCHVSSLLRVGTMQILLAMLEAGHADRDLILDDPLDAVLRYSHDPDLATTAVLSTGEEVTAVQLQRRFLESARPFVASGECDACVPGAAAILALWEQTLTRLEARDFHGLFGWLDWVTKRTVIERAMHARPGLAWRSAEVRHLDQIYASLDEHEGIYWALERAGCVRRLVSDEQITRFTRAPPDDTRAYQRAMLLRQFGRDGISAVDWDRVTLRTSTAADRLERLQTVTLRDPLAGTRAELEAAARAAAAAKTDEPCFEDEPDDDDAPTRAPQAVDPPAHHH